MNTSMAGPKPRRWMQFGLKTLLFIILCLCGILAGYRAGYYGGAEAKRRQSIYPKTYPVTGLVEQVSTPNGLRDDYDTLIQVITTTIDPESWDAVGGPGSLSEYPPSRSLVIRQSGDAHDRIEALLSELRQNRKATKEKRPAP